MATVKHTKLDSNLERQIVTAMVVSTPFLREVQDMYAPKLLTTNHTRTVAGWCLDYFKRYGKAPGKHIEQRFERAVRKQEVVDEHEIELLRRLLAYLSDEYDRTTEDAGGLNVEYLLDEAEDWFRSQDLKELSSELRDALEEAGPEEAEMLLRQHQTVVRAEESYFQPLVDRRRGMRLFEKPPTPLFHLPGALGEALDQHMVRGGFVSYLGPEKRGKTWWIMDNMLRACQARNNVVYFEVGDLSEDDVWERIGSRCAGLPWQLMEPTYVVPHMDCKRNQLGTCRSPLRKCRVQLYSDESQPPDPSGDVCPKGYKVCTACDDRGLKRTPEEIWIPAVFYEKVMNDTELNWTRMDKALDRLRKRMGNRQFRISVHPNTSVNVEDLNELLLRWKEREGFVPDVIGIDYADILAKEEGCREERDSQNERWKAMRRMSQTWHALLITATQGNRESYESDTIKMGHITEDKRKLGHVTACFGLNQTAMEKHLQLMRINPVVMRRRDNFRGRQIVSTMCLERGEVSTGSFWMRPQPKKEESD